METNEFWDMINKLFDQNTYNTKHKVVLRLWDLNGQLILKHYQGDNDVYVIYPN